MHLPQSGLPAASSDWIAQTFWTIERTALLIERPKEEKVQTADNARKDSRPERFWRFSSSSTHHSSDKHRNSEHEDVNGEGNQIADVDPDVLKFRDQRRHDDAQHQERR